MKTICFTCFLKVDLFRFEFSWGPLLGGLGPHFGVSGGHLGPLWWPRWLQKSPKSSQEVSLWLPEFTHVAPRPLMTLSGIPNRPPKTFHDALRHPQKIPGSDAEAKKRIIEIASTKAFRRMPAQTTAEGCLAE